MAGFRKAKAEQAFLKVGIYGPPGSGKTFTTLLIAEGLSKITKKGIGYVDTERGTDYYSQAVQQRPVHPDAFDFDALYTRSISEIMRSVQQLSPRDHSVIVIDSITHIWDSAKAAYAGKMTRTGTIPLYAWGGIKRPYKELMAWLINSPFHVFLLGRQANEYGESEDGDEQKKVGVKMRAEGETAYEPHISIRMESVRNGRDWVPTAYVEKDRTGVLQGRTIQWPNYQTICEPLVGLLGMKQAKVQTEAEAGEQDAEAFETADREKAEESANILRKERARLEAADTDDEVKAIAKTITSAVKARMTASDVSSLREAYLAAEARTKGVKKGKTEIISESQVENIKTELDGMRGHYREAFTAKFGPVDQLPQTRFDEAVEWVMTAETMGVGRKDSDDA